MHGIVLKAFTLTRPLRVSQSVSQHFLALPHSPLPPLSPQVRETEALLRAKNIEIAQLKNQLLTRLSPQLREHRDSSFAPAASPSAASAVGSAPSALPHTSSNGAGQLGKDSELLMSDAILHFFDPDMSMRDEKDMEVIEEQDETEVSPTEHGQGGVDVGSANKSNVSDFGGNTSRDVLALAPHARERLAALLGVCVCACVLYV